jgi:DNA-binding transcriptional LysR family regulator
MQWSDRIGRRIKLRDMHILLAVARSGSMGKAAAELAMSQPAVSKAISDLEHALGLRLLDRSPQGIEPTLYGEALLRRGTVLFDDLKQTVKELEFLSDPTVGELSIGCPEPIADGFVAAIIERFSREYPKVQFNVITADSATLHRRELAQRNIEIALGWMFEPLPAQHANVETLFDDRWVLTVAANSPWARKRSLTIAQLIGELWVLPPPDSPVGSYIANGFHAAGVEPPRASVLTFSLPLHRRLLTTGRYLTALPLSMLHYGATSLRGLAVKFPARPRPVAIMTLKNRTLSPLAERFIDCARELARPLASNSMANSPVARR